MKTDTSDATDARACGTLPAATVFSLLADAQRRYTMHYLAGKVGAVAIGDVAEQIALREGDLSRDRFERIVTGLYHVHLPKLRDAGVVDFDLDVETVERLPAADRLTPYLELALRDELG